MQKSSALPGFDDFLQQREIILEHLRAPARSARRWSAGGRGFPWSRRRSPPACRVRRWVTRLPSLSWSSPLRSANDQRTRVASSVMMASRPRSWMILSILSKSRVMAVSGRMVFHDERPGLDGVEHPRAARPRAGGIDEMVHAERRAHDRRRIKARGRGQVHLRQERLVHEIDERADARQQERPAEHDDRARGEAHRGEQPQPVEHEPHQGRQQRQARWSGSARR